jgi:hypothetical protein
MRLFIAIMLSDDMKKAVTGGNSSALVVSAAVEAPPKAGLQAYRDRDRRVTL